MYLARRVDCAGDALFDDAGTIAPYIGTVRVHSARIQMTIFFFVIYYEIAVVLVAFLLRVILFAKNLIKKSKLKIHCNLLCAFFIYFTTFFGKSITKNPKELIIYFYNVQLRRTRTD